MLSALAKWISCQSIYQFGVRVIRMPIPFSLRFKIPRRFRNPPTNPLLRNITAHLTSDSAGSQTAIPLSRERERESIEMSRWYSKRELVPQTLTLALIFNPTHITLQSISSFEWSIAENSYNIYSRIRGKRRPARVHTVRTIGPSWFLSVVHLVTSNLISIF